MRVAIQLLFHTQTFCPYSKYNFNVLIGTFYISLALALAWFIVNYNYNYLSTLHNIPEVLRSHTVAVAWNHTYST
jgi:hypothetical protein